MMMKPLPKAAQSWRELFADPNQAIYRMLQRLGGQ
jgi:hypothetical protein